PLMATRSSQRHDLLVLDENICAHLIGGGDDGSSGDDCPCHGYQPPVARLKASPRMSRPSATSSAVTVRGGAMRRELPYSPPLPIKSFPALASSMTRAVSPASGSPEAVPSSTPIIRPLPRTSSISGISA